jgi:hypothetical protein
VFSGFLNWASEGLPNVFDVFLVSLTWLSEC